MELVAAKPGSLEASFAGATEVACPNISDCGDDDGGQGLNSRIVYSPRETNLFYINVSDLKVNFTPEPFSPSREGTYTLSVTDITDIPRIVTDGVRVTSTPASGDAYREGENIEITVTFSKAVVVSGSPQFEFCMGSGECVDGDDPPAWRRASLISGNGTTELVFTYTVQTGDSDGDGIWIGDHTRTLKLDAEDTIQDVSSRKDAILNHDAPGAEAGHRVDSGGGRNARQGDKKPAHLNQAGAAAATRCGRRLPSPPSRGRPNQGLHSPPEEVQPGTGPGPRPRRPPGLPAAAWPGEY